MPSFIGMGLPRTSELVVDSDITIPAAYKIYARSIQALTGGNLGLYDNTGSIQSDIRVLGVILNGTGVIYANVIREYTTGSRVIFPHGLKTDTIDDNGGGLVNILESVSLPATKYLASPSLMGDNILDYAGTGKPGFSQGLKADHIAENTGAHGIVFDNEALMSALEALLTQRYRTAAAGATARYTSAAEATIPNPGATPTQIKSTVTVPAWYAGAANTLRIAFEGKAQNVSADDEMYITINDVEVGTRLALSNAGYVSKSQDLGTISAGDTIKIMVVNPAGTGGIMYCRNFVISSTDTVNLPMTTETWP